ncbi:IS630 family transposase [Histomonas meleagridis]|uniref:IS630 family transposase n=1 Tax=Histomonas meleagridis TaxID=135588 RepID=UPI003559BC79|nr:IS630 family transposase [Histomonas meleagridis]KAH0801439.1 IS630 family transposase [Histomonas meleagridis]
MDETGLWNGSVSQRTYVNPSTMDSVGVVSPGDHKRDTGVVALSADGTIHPYFISHSPQKTKKVNGRSVVVKKKVAGMGFDQMNQWSEEFANKYGNPSGTVLIMDRLRVHMNSKIKKNLEEKHVECFYLPPQNAKLASVCDDSFFSVLKSRISKMDTTTTEKKKKGFFSLCEEFPEKMVKNFYHHCGWNFE